MLIQVVRAQFVCRPIESNFLDRFHIHAVEVMEVTVGKEKEFEWATRTNCARRVISLLGGKMPDEK